MGTRKSYGFTSWVTYSGFLLHYNRLHEQCHFYHLSPLDFTVLPSYFKWRAPREMMFYRVRFHFREMDKLLFLLLLLLIIFKFMYSLLWSIICQYSSLCQMLCTSDLCEEIVFTYRRFFYGENAGSGRLGPTNGGGGASHGVEDVIETAARESLTCYTCRVSLYDVTDPLVWEAMEFCSVKCLSAWSHSFSFVHQMEPSCCFA